MATVIQFKEAVFLRTVCSTISRALNQSPLVSLTTRVTFKGKDTTFTVSKLTLDEKCVDNDPEDVAKLFIELVGTAIEEHRELIPKLVHLELEVLSTSRTQVKLGLQERYYVKDIIHQLHHPKRLNYLPFFRFR